MQIASIPLANRLFVAPMAGVTDRPFRSLCRSFGAGYAVSEMVTSRPNLQNSLKTSTRTNHQGELGPIAVQIAGTEPIEMAQAAQHNIARGAQVIDINMGCPAKKVCRRWAGSALMQNPRLATQIIQAVVQASAPKGVPVTLKMRTGWDEENKNALDIALAAQDAGIAMLTIHGRTRTQKYTGHAEYDTIAKVKERLSIPVVANGDIDSPQKAQWVLKHTACDALMVGRAAQGRPWIFREIAHYLEHGTLLQAPLVAEVRKALRLHLLQHHALYGEALGVRSARKHIAWYVANWPNGLAFSKALFSVESASVQLSAVDKYLEQLEATHERIPSN